MKSVYKDKVILSYKILQKVKLILKAFLNIKRSELIGKYSEKINAFDC